MRYRGYYYDNETGYYYLQSRYYDPQICRFINADSFNFINTSSRISINAYAYCENDPINFVDPFGFSATLAGGGAALLGKLLAEFLAALGTALMAVGSVLLGVILISAIIEIFNSNTSSASTTKYLSDTKAKEQTGNHYKIAYINSRGELIKLGKKLTFIQALNALGLTATTNSINCRYNFVYYESKVSNDVKTAHSNGKWGIYADTQEAAKALAVVLGSTQAPEVHGDDYYGHYHANPHDIHIWYGSPIHY